MANKITVLHVVKNLTVGGLERVVVNICNGLDRAVFEPAIVMLTNEDDAMACELKEDVQVYTLPYPYRENVSITTLRKQYKSLKQLLAQLQPDIVHAHIYATRLYLLARAAKYASPQTKLVKTEHLHGVHYESSKIADRLKVLIEQKAYKAVPSYLIAISKPIDRNNRQHFYRQVSKFYLVNNGIDSNAFNRLNVATSKKALGFDEEDTIIIHVGRFAPVKNHKTILSAWQLVKRDSGMSSLKLVLVGDGPERSAIERQIEEFGIRESVVLTGNVSNVPDYLSVASVALLPSLLEGFPLVMLEEMYMKLPMIVSDIDVFKGVITNGKSGLIVPVLDAAKLADTIIRLIQNEEERTRIGECGYRLIEAEYTLEKMVVGYENCYKEIVGYSK